MKVIMTFKPLNYFHSRATHAGLALINIEKKSIENVLLFPGATFKTNEAFFTNFAQGLAIDNGIAYVGLWNYVAVVDLRSFKVIDALTSPEFSDIHGITTDDKHLYIVSTASEVLSCFCKKKLEMKWLWGPNAKILTSNNNFKFIPATKNKVLKRIIQVLGLQKSVAYPIWKNKEHRYIHKTRSKYYRHHMNNITIYKNEIFINTKGWFDTRTSAVILLNKELDYEEFFVKPGGFIGSHDGVFYNDNYYVTEADNGSIAWRCFDGTIKRKKIMSEGYFIRGLEKVNGGWIVGFSPLRGSGNYCFLSYYDDHFQKEIAKIYLNELLPRDIGVAVHSIKSYN